MRPFLQATLLASFILGPPFVLGQSTGTPLLQVESCCATNGNAQKRHLDQSPSTQVGMIPTNRARSSRSPRPVEYLGDHIALRLNSQGTTAATRRPVAWLFLRTSVRPTLPTRQATAQRTKPRTSPPVIPRTAPPKTATPYVLLIPKTAPTVRNPVNSMPLLKELKLLPTLTQIRLQTDGAGVPPDNEKLIPQLIWKTVRPTAPSKTMMSTRPMPTPRPSATAIDKQPVFPQPVDSSDFDVPDFVKQPCFPCRDCCCCDKLPVPCVNPQQQWLPNGLNCYCPKVCQNRPCCCCSSCNNICHHSGGDLCCCNQQSTPVCGSYPSPFVSESYCPGCPDAKPVCFCYPGYEEIHIPPAPSQAAAENLIPAPAYPPHAQPAYQPFPPVYPLPPAYPPPLLPAHPPPSPPAYPPPSPLAYPPPLPSAYPPHAQPAYQPFPPVYPLPPAYPPPSPPAYPPPLPPAYPPPLLPANPPPSPPAYPPPSPPAYPPPLPPAYSPPPPVYLPPPSNALRPILPPEYLPLPHQAYPPPIPVYPGTVALSYQLPPAQYHPPQQPQALSAG